MSSTDSKLRHILYQFEQRSHSHRVAVVSEQQLTTRLATELNQVLEAIQALYAPAQPAIERTTAQPINPGSLQVTGDFAPAQVGGDEAVLLDKVFTDFENSGPPWANVQSKIQYEGIRDYLKPKLQSALSQLIQAEREAARSTPTVDLNDPQYMLRFIDDPIEKFKMFIKKWCPDYSHLIDTDDNDGQEIRNMLNRLTRPEGEK
ncbi:MAG TPA: hypothetical protein VJ836_00660 [Candidatus Saccharimonadales bacterium]|nr:hypothetical protein [Candidatus Saccharimonadales bacterium]